jgi:rare lipoprotein A
MAIYTKTYAVIVIIIVLSSLQSCYNAQFVQLEQNSNRLFLTKDNRHTSFHQVFDYEQSDLSHDSSELFLIYGKASFYGSEFNGRKTANGEIYDESVLTAAHRTLPFGTFLSVTNTRNNRSVIVRINDRGPFHPHRILDVSKLAAEELDMIKYGVAEIEAEILDY